MEINEKEERSKRGRRSKNRGANGERELVNLIRDTWGYPVARGRVYYGESDMVGLKGIHPEIKRTERVQIYKFMDQAIEEAEKKKDGVPVVFFRSNKRKWLVTMDLELFMDMYGGWIDGR